MTQFSKKIAFRNREFFLSLLNKYEYIIIETSRSNPAVWERRVDAFRKSLEGTNAVALSQLYGVKRQTIYAWFLSVGRRLLCIHSRLEQNDKR